LRGPHFTFEHAPPAKADEWSTKYGIPRTHIYNYERFEKIATNGDIDIGLRDLRAIEAIYGSVRTGTESPVAQG